MKRITAAILLMAFAQVGAPSDRPYASLRSKRADSGVLFLRAAGLTSFQLLMAVPIPRGVFTTPRRVGESGAIHNWPLKHKTESEVLVLGCLTATSRRRLSKAILVVNRSKVGGGDRRDLHSRMDRGRRALGGARS